MKSTRLTVRTRLTLIYGGMFAVSGALLLVVAYVLMVYWPTRKVILSPVSASPPGDGRAVIVAPPDNDVLSTLLGVSALALALVTVLTLGLGWITAGRILAPLHHITDTARRIAAGNRDERIRLGSPNDELKDLADTFDGMLDRLHAAFDAQKRFAANASHELRTPLAATRTMLQVALAHPDACDIHVLGPKLLAINQRSHEITEALLTLADADHAAVDPRPVDLAVLTTDVLTQAAARAAQCGVTVIDDLRPATVAGDATLLRHLITNLVHNAIQHNHRDGTASVTVTSNQWQAELTVANGGTRVPEQDVDQLFEPFHRHRPRTAASNAGHGLGLAIARAIVQAHTGHIIARANPEGGLTVTVTVPIHDGRRAGEQALGSSDPPPVRAPTAEPSRSARRRHGRAAASHEARAPSRTWSADR